MRRLRAGLSITRAAVLVLLACAVRVGFCQDEGETITIMLPGDVPLDMIRSAAGSFEMGLPESEVSRGHD